VVKYAISRGWTYIVRKGKGHIVGILRCSNEDKCHQLFVHGTPEPAEEHAKHLISCVDKCI
ncbi:hypothetical protein P3692_26610, partial [Vibrio parahaemolyticus]|nr:hypothetical protein [Vibrio parahaemolyticus]